MSELIDREALKDAVKRYAGEPIKEKDRKCQAICLDMLGTIDAQPAASPWHRVEEPPEPHKNVLVTGMEAINNLRVYKVMVNDNGTWRPTDYAPSIRWDYWMPIEPPKEDA